jgi:hypothetical protein
MLSPLCPTLEGSIFIYTGGSLFLIVTWLVYFPAVLNAGNSNGYLCFGDTGMRPGRNLEVPLKKERAGVKPALFGEFNSKGES